MSFVNSISALGKNTSNKMKETTEIIRLNAQISDLEKALNQMYLEIGECICTMDAENAKHHIEPKMQTVKKYQSQLAEMKKQLNTLKGSVECPECHTIAKSGTQFCSVCGYSFPLVEKSKCRRCGALLDADQMFCTICGEAANASQSSNVCIHCGKQITQGTAFCRFCGNPIK